MPDADRHALQFPRGIQNGLRQISGRRGQWIEHAVQALYWDGVGATATQKIYLPELDPASTKQKWSSNPVASASNTIKDPWGIDYNYRSGLTDSGEVNSNCINPDFDIWSFGPDAQEGSNGDKKSADNITNWK